MARAFAYLYGAGGTLVLLTLLLPVSDDVAPAGMVVPALLAYGVVILMLTKRERLPLWVFPALPAFGAVLITSIAYSSGTESFNAYALLYFWVIVSAFFFLSWWQALPSLVLVAVGYGIVLLHHDDAEGRLLYWLMGFGTLAVAGMVLATLRASTMSLLAALRENDLLKTTIIRSVSHDFRTPLTAIIAAGESSASPTLDREDREEVASVIVSEASRLSETLAKLIDMSRLEGGAAAPHRDWCSVEELIEVALARTPSSERFEVSLERSLPLVWADAGQIERVLANLFENSSRFAGDSPVEVSARAQDGSVVITVRDHGPGIPAQDQGRIFEAFFRGDSRGAGHRGPGLGLAIAKGFVESNGGVLRVDSKPGAGTAFVIELPAVADRTSTAP